jgi:hypothetical protein
VTAYEDLDDPQTMHGDAAAAEARLPLVALGLPYTDLYADFPFDAPKRGLEVTVAAQRIANALHLHLD